MSIQVISFNCLLKNALGDVISSTLNTNVLTLAEASGPFLKGFVQGLQDLTKGEKRSISLTAAEAYGPYENQKVILYPKKKLRQHLGVGEVISITGKSGTARSYKVVQFHDDMASLDGNHPLAGQDLIFEIETLDVRNATRKEIAESTNGALVQKLH
jgi:FKBP-type peptidyl-prolyl cis-trans isomerase SlyD